MIRIDDILRIALSSGGDEIVLETEDICFVGFAMTDSEVKSAFANQNADFNGFMSIMKEVASFTPETNMKSGDMRQIKFAFTNESRAVLGLAYAYAISTRNESPTLADFLLSVLTCKSDVAKYIAYVGVSDYLKLLNDISGGAYKYKNIDKAVEAVMRVSKKLSNGDMDFLYNYSKNPFVSMLFFNGKPSSIEVSGIGEDSDDYDESCDSMDFCIDLREVVETRDDKLIGRETEVDKTIQVLCRKKKNNVMHIGAAGVGKTAIMYGLAKAINDGSVPEKIKDSKVYMLDTGALVGGTRFRGDLEQRLDRLIKTLAKEPKVILYIDEIHMLMGRNGEEGTNIANYIKKALMETDIRFVGATTLDEYRKYIEKDSAFARRFENIVIKEPTPDEAKAILRGLIKSYEDFHGVVYESSAIDYAVDLSVKYVHDKYLPDKAIDIIDDAGALFSKNNEHGVVTSDIIERVVSTSYNIPKETITKDDRKLVLELEAKIKSKLFGQDEAVKEVVKAIKLSRAGLTQPNKPIASFLLVGQTGVGKTELARQVADNLGISLIKFDMSEYMDETSVNKLIGSSAGYVGYEDGGLLVEKIRNNPYCVLLLDEIEKAHPKVFNAFLQVMDDARLTDNKGRVADFKNVIIIMTSNAGASGVKHKGLGFGSSDTYDYANMGKAVESAFSPEFRNRLTKVITLNPMNEAMAEAIVKRELDKLKSQLKSKGIKANFTPSLTKYCLERGITKEFGARPLLRVIDDEIKFALVDDLIDGELTKCTITVKGGQIVVNK